MRLRGRVRKPGEHHVRPNANPSRRVLVRTIRVVQMVEHCDQGRTNQVQENYGTYPRSSTMKYSTRIDLLERGVSNQRELLQMRSIPNLMFLQTIKSNLASSHNPSLTN